MIRFTLRLVARSSAWVAPALVYLIWVAVTIGGGSAALSNAPGLFYASLVWATWTTVSIGNLDTDDHRDLLASVSGSAATLHVRRAMSAVALALPVGIAASVVTVAVGASDDVVRDWLVCVSMAMSGSLLGTSFGTLLHRPILRHRGLTVVAAVLLIVVTVVSPPSIWALDHSRAGDAVGSMIITIALGLWCAVVVAVASLLASSRAR